MNPHVTKIPENPHVFIFYLQAPQDPSGIPEQMKLAYLTSSDLR